jgi:hypothetical protein
VEDLPHAVEIVLFATGEALYNRGDFVSANRAFVQSLKAIEVQDDYDHTDSIAAKTYAPLTSSGAVDSIFFTATFNKNSQERIDDLLRATLTGMGMVLVCALILFFTIQLT